METATIRPATGVDARPIQEVARTTWASTYEGVIPADIQQQAIDTWYAPDSLRAQLSRDDSHLLISEVTPGKPLGFAQFIRVSDTAGELTRIYVLPMHQGKGHGAALLEAGLAWLRDLGLTELIVSVEQDNPIGRAFYERNEFEETGISTQQIYGHELSTVLYKRSV